MNKVEIYTKPTCGYCARAKHLLQSKGVKYKEINITAEPHRRSEMISRAAGRSTVPQIFINGESIGGSDELHMLERQGKLNNLLAE